MKKLLFLSLLLPFSAQAVVDGFGGLNKAKIAGDVVTVTLENKVPPGKIAQDLTCRVWLSVSASEKPGLYARVLRTVRWVRLPKNTSVPLAFNFSLQSMGQSIAAVEDLRTRCLPTAKENAYWVAHDTRLDWFDWAGISVQPKLAAQLNKPTFNPM